MEVSNIQVKATFVFSSSRTKAYCIELPLIKTKTSHYRNSFEALFCRVYFSINVFLSYWAMFPAFVKNSDRQDVDLLVASGEISI